MNTPILLPSLALSLLLSPAAAGPSALDTGPQLTVDEQVHEFGDTWEGTTLEHTFTLTSSGTEDLVIDKIHASCGCTLASVWRLGPDGSREPYEEGTPLPPGEKLELVAAVDTSFRKGTLNKPVTVYSNDPRGAVEIWLKAKVKRILALARDELRMGRFAVRKGRTRSMELKSNDRQPIALSLIEDQDLPEGVSATLEPVEPDEEGRAQLWNFSITVAPYHEDGSFTYAVGIRTDRENPLALAGEDRYLTQYLKVTGMVVGLISITPVFCSFGIVDDDQVTSRAVRVSSNDPDLGLQAPSVEILEADTDEPYALADHFHVTVTPVPAVPGGAYDIELTNSELPADLTGAFRGRLRLSFSEKEIPDQDVSFTGFHRVTSGTR